MHLCVTGRKRWPPSSLMRSIASWKARITAPLSDVLVPALQAYFLD